MAAANPALADIKGDVALRLEASGALDELRARIRASVYRALLNTEGAGAPQGPRGAPPQPLAVVADFLQRLDFDNTREVFLREAGDRPLDCEDVRKALAGRGEAAGADVPVLEQAVAAARRRAAQPEERGRPAE
eukprot:CAMPEP_0168476284 /NCGR_PEP_ID=MMETSP0228-20121227/61812_1 /TAXON_ID=133427 /ORGANISM="Protoceratium reticulatum, Strain CCCM 535 (=CCMP 1889)" /LENGTH=133 /DNA_ID=CAMNT_0008492407 /DNA_START=45 /DNA_END=443 /DNA_ORIENTATION=-